MYEILDWEIFLTIVIFVVAQEFPDLCIVNYVNRRLQCFLLQPKMGG